VVAAPVNNFVTEGDAMRRIILLTTAIASVGVALSCSTATQQTGTAADPLLEQLVALERSALDRWIKADPDGYLGLYVPDVTYFDPTVERRVDGLPALQARFAPMRNAVIPVRDARYEMIGAKVQRHGDVALLSFNLVNYARIGDGPESVLARWNSTEVYRRVDGTWKIFHSHWSFVQPPRPGS
jgi:ketosteroid isomerase-like protein